MRIRGAWEEKGKFFGGVGGRRTFYKVVSNVVMIKMPSWVFFTSNIVNPSGFFNRFRVSIYLFILKQVQKWVNQQVNQQNNVSPVSFLFKKQWKILWFFLGGRGEKVSYFFSADMDVDHSFIQIRKPCLFFRKPKKRWKKKIQTVFFFPGKVNKPFIWKFWCCLPNYPIYVTKQNEKK